MFSLFHHIPRLPFPRWAVVVGVRFLKRPSSVLLVQRYGEIFNITNISGIIFRVLSFINVVYVHGHIIAQNGRNVQ